MGPDHRVAARRAALVALVATCAGTACKGHAPEGAGASATESASPTSSTRPPLDRLAPGELSPGTESVYGMVLPRGMRVSAHFPGIAHAAGPLPVEDVSNYVRDRVDVQRVELGAVGTVFPSVHVRGGDPAQLLRIEVQSAGANTELVFHDVTPVPPKPVDPNVPVEERWRRAGYKPDGTPLNPNTLH